MSKQEGALWQRKGMLERLHYLAGLGTQEGLGISAQVAVLTDQNPDNWKLLYVCMYVCLYKVSCKTYHNVVMQVSVNPHVWNHYCEGLPIWQNHLVCAFVGSSRKITTGCCLNACGLLCF